MCLSTKARSVTNNFAEFQSLIDQQLPAITGSWCSSCISNAEMHLKSCNLYHFDRSNSVGGGDLLYVHESLPTVMCDKLMECSVDNFL